MTSDPRLTIELNTLCGKLREGEITDTEALRLDEILRTSRSARRFYRTFMALASALESRATLQGWDDLDAGDEHNLVLLSQLLEIEQQAEQLALPAKAEPVDAAGIDRPREDRLGWRDIAGASSYLLGRALKSRPAKYAYAYAALFLLAATLIFALVTSDGPGTRQNLAGTNEADLPADVPTPVATLTATYNAAWAGPASAAPTQGDALRPNRRLTLTAGFAEITTKRGAVAILEAPATIELTDNNNAIRLLTGKLVGICETPTSKGFLVRTPHMDITDLGTRFGVDAIRSDATEVHVFDGEVELSRPAIGTRQAIRITLLQNQAARAEVSTPGFVDRPIDANQFAGIQIFDQAPLDATAAEAGIRAVSGQLQWSDNRFTGRLPNDWSSDNAIVYQELRGYTLSTDVAVTIDQPGTYNRFMRRSASATIPRGTVIRSYILLFKPGQQAGAAAAQGQVSFDGEVLGIIANEPHWLAFTSLLPERTFYPNLEENILINGGADKDQLILDADKRTLSFHFSVTTGTADTIRVLVREPVAATN